MFVPLNLLVNIIIPETKYGICDFLIFRDLFIIYSLPPAYRCLQCQHFCHKSHYQWSPCTLLDDKAFMYHLFLHRFLMKQFPLFFPILKCRQRIRQQIIFIIYCLTKQFLLYWQFRKVVIFNYGLNTFITNHRLYCLI